MAKNKNNNIIYIGIAVVVVVIAIVVGVVLMNNNKGSSDQGNNGGTAQNSNGGASEGTELKASELENVDVVVEYGDYDGMYDLSKSIQNGEMVGKVVKIDGDVSHPMSTYSIMQHNADGSQSIGTQFVIEGNVEYPDDDDRAVITGKVIETDPMVFVIQTIPGYVQEIDTIDNDDIYDDADDVYDVYDD